MKLYLCTFLIFAYYKDRISAKNPSISANGLNGPETYARIKIINPYLQMTDRGDYDKCEFL